jgi:hypothetical protein
MEVTPIMATAPVAAVYELCEKLSPGNDRYSASDSAPPAQTSFRMGALSVPARAQDHSIQQEFHPAGRRGLQVCAVRQR